MKVILTKDVKDLGRAHSEVSVSDGYALNYLIPRKMAVLATSAAKQAAEKHRQHAHDRSTLDAALLKQNIASLADAHLVIKMKANAKGHLYDAVGEETIAEAAKQQVGVDLPETIIKIEKPIKELGTFEIPVSSGSTFGVFSITIEAE